MRVLFWGTPEFALPPLRALLGEGFDVAGVVTQPDRAVGRSRSTLRPPAVKQVAVEEGLTVLQPERPRGDEFVARLRELRPDLSVVVAYGNILPSSVIELPRLGTINIHASLLPKLRGAAPIQGAILGGLTETGVSIMRMVQALDAGPVILQVATPIPEDETYGELSLRLSELGALALIQALALIEMGHLIETVQEESEATYAPKVERAMTRVNWSAEAREISRVIRAYDPKPGAVTTLRGAEIKLFGARYAPATTASADGEVIGIDAEGMLVACGMGAVRVAAVHPAGKRRVAPGELALGNGIAVGDRLS